MSDVQLASPAQYDVLMYDGSNWYNHALNLDDLNDVTIDANTLADGDVITWDSTAHKYVNKSIPTPTVPDELDDLSDVSITTPSNGDVIMYDNNTGDWINATLPQVVNVNIQTANITLNDTVNAGDVVTKTVTASGNYTDRPLIFNPLVSSAIGSDISIDNIRLVTYTSTTFTVSLTLRNNSATAQTIQGLIYLYFLVR